MKSHAYFSNNNETSHSFKKGAALPCPKTISQEFSKHVHVFDYKPSGSAVDDVPACCRELEADQDGKVANMNWRPERTAHLLEHQAEITVSRDMAHDKFNINAPEFASLDTNTFLIAASRAASVITS
jgi:hypothetical protein